MINNLFINNEFSNVNNTNNFGNLFLQKKRNYEQSILNNCWNNYILPKKEIEFSIRKKEAKLDELEKILLAIKNKNEYNEKSRGINYNIINNSKQYMNEPLKNKDLNLEKMNSNFPPANGSINSMHNNLIKNTNIDCKCNEFEEKNSDDLEKEINMNYMK